MKRRQEKKRKSSALSQAKGKEKAMPKFMPKEVKTMLDKSKARFRKDEEVVWSLEAVSKWEVKREPECSPLGPTEAAEAKALAAGRTAIKGLRNRDTWQVL
ncbi:unnamed protein product [Symbiodinium natans]|uniref:Uncharacterized protein n=1 Tax=Symbiodinium natans TaxID=878477 RepID=A0A812PKK9_9DINO|nr:unnamed protein product [Symbiodinium natans]